MVWFGWERRFDLLVGGNDWKVSMAFLLVNLAREKPG